MIKNLLCLLAIIGGLSSCVNPQKQKEQKLADEIENPTNKVVLSSEIVWEKLNPDRGALSPQAGTIWGDRNDSVPTGFLAKFVDGFSSPPHIHNVTYRAVVISGLIHNDDPNAEQMWMKPGSFWTQPVGEPHITAAKGEENIALVEIDYGPYLVKPLTEAFDDGERPVNIDGSNVVWLNSDKCNWVNPDSKAELSFLWRNKEYNGLFIKLPKGYDGVIESNGMVLHAVVIQGGLDYKMPQNKDVKGLDVGSYFGSSDRAFHSIVTNSDVETILYVRTNGKVKVD
ncbi:MAG: hypothetical protein BM564_08775 [Bacteroidetes bacterium MedPE-SWsnd-G2]|nr:MAG: hypothetical protein BM564_08775 [Bacteroidetes bacterium MedPE-SWsnd-G2]